MTYDEKKKSNDSPASLLEIPAMSRIYHQSISGWQNSFLLKCTRRMITKRPKPNARIITTSVDQNLSGPIGGQVITDGRGASPREESRSSLWNKFYFIEARNESL